MRKYSKDLLMALLDCEVQKDIMISLDQRQEQE